MICYHDRTYCGFHKDCKLSRRCGRALTKKILKEAKRHGLPICQFVNKPGCFRKRGG